MIKRKGKFRLFSKWLAVLLVAIVSLVALIGMFPYLQKMGNLKTALIVLAHIAGPLLMLSIWTWSLRRKMIRKSKALEAEQMRNHKLEALGVLAGGIAHDFNNILAAILGSVSTARRVLKRPEAADKVDMLLETAQKATQQAEALIGQLMTFSKGGDPVREPVEVRPLIEEAAEIALHGSNVDSIIHTVTDIWPIEVDQNQIIQVLSNLIINADQAMPDGGTIRLSAQNIPAGSQQFTELGDRPYVCIRLEDEGVGIDKTILPRIYDPYFSTKEHGAGLGLAMSLSIVDKHNGHIHADSTPGVGTTFDVVLPATTQRPEEKVTDELTSKRTPGRVLIMDDDEAVLQMASQMVAELGYEVVKVSDGEAAVEQVQRSRDKNTPFDLVLMDLTIRGGMGGKDAISRLRQIDPQVPAVVSSGYSDDPIMSDYAHFGFNGALSKPYTIEDLNRAIASSQSRSTGNTA